MLSVGIYLNCVIVCVNSVIIISIVKQKKSFIVQIFVSNIMLIHSKYTSLSQWIFSKWKQRLQENNTKHHCLHIKVTNKQKKKRRSAKILYVDDAGIEKCLITSNTYWNKVYVKSPHLSRSKFHHKVPK